MYRDLYGRGERPSLTHIFFLEGWSVENFISYHGNHLYIHLRMFKMNNTHGISKSNAKEKLHMIM